MITHLKVNLSPELFIQLFYTYFRSIWNARSQITGDGDVTSATIKVILGKMDSNLAERMARKSSLHCYICHNYKPEEYSTFFLGRLGDYVYRLFQIQDNMRKETRYGKHVPYISSPSCSSSCLKSITLL